MVNSQHQDLVVEVENQLMHYRSTKLGKSPVFILKKYFLFYFFFTSCSSYHKVTADKEYSLSQSNSQEYQELIASVENIVNAGGNHYRKKAIIKQLDAFGLKKQTRQERIDWLSVQKNVIVDLPGKSDSLMYIVAHYDKTDANPLKAVSVLLNGLLDPLISWSYTTQGAIDNATGVAVAMQLMKALKEKDNHYSYRLLLTGSEESGIRGSRAHVARLTLNEFNKIKFVVNIDVVGVKGKQNCVYDVSDNALEKLALSVSNRHKLDLGEGEMPAIGGGDYVPFKKTNFGLDFSRSFKYNSVGSILPQRSYFTKKKSTKVINFSACELLDVGDYIASTILLPVGSLHGYRDNIKKVDPYKLFEMYQIINLFLEEIEN